MDADVLGVADDLEYAKRWAKEIGVLDLLERAVGESNGN
jgi:hypothetical protein